MENYVKKEVGISGTVRHYDFKRRWHRLDGPAIKYKCGSASWYVNGKAHRLDGPAITWANNETDEWCINDETYSKSCHNRLVLFSVLEPQRIVLGSTEEE